MNFKVIAKYSVVIYLLLIISGIPIGYFMGDADYSNEKVTSWFFYYKYASLFLISFFSFCFLAKSSTNKAFYNGLIVVLVVSLLSLIVDSAILPEINYFLWFLDVFFVFTSLILGLGANRLLRNNKINI